jgi:hypothetical protein
MVSSFRHFDDVWGVSQQKLPLIWYVEQCRRIGRLIIYCYILFYLLCSSPF